jgi:cytoskeletal protein CcmA (bactofilin family)
MNMSAGIGQTIRIKGDVTAREPFLIAGQVEGTVEVEGHTVTVAEGATVAAIVSADTVDIQGTVKGEISASSRIVVQLTAKIEGELSAPTISITEGAFIHGKVETTQRKATLAVAS